MLLPVTVLVGIFSICLGLDQNDLYPYGDAAGDMTLTPSDEYKVMVDLPDNFVYFRRSYRRAYVDINGFCSLNRAFEDSHQVQLLPLNSPPLICPLWCDANTRLGGNIYYRVVTKENDISGLLMRARQEIMAYFIDNQMFQPSYIFIVTWDDIAYNQTLELTNTFQAVMMSDGVNSFTSFLYPTNGINWPPTDQPPNSIAGFNFGNGIRALVIPHTELTHEILNIEDTSNVHSTGKWLFHVNQFRILSPPYNVITQARIIFGPRDMVVEYGDLISVTCIARGWPIPFVTFTRDGTSFMNDPRFAFEILPEDSFTISAVFNLTSSKVTDTGEYSCLAIALESEEAGQDEISFFVGILGSPEIIFITNNDTFVSTTERYLRCVAQGYPTPNIYWKSNALSFNTGYGESNYTLTPYTANTYDGYILTISVLTLHPVFPDDHGTYTCIATNPVGEHRSSVDITVLSEPAISKKPTNTTLYNGDIHQFLCEAKGRPPPIITWRIYGRLLSNSTNTFITVTVTNDYIVSSNMTLNNATLEDVGTYECNAANELGDSSEIFSINVYAAVDIIYATPKAYVFNNDTVVLSCTVKGNPPVENIVWTATHFLYTAIHFSMMETRTQLDEFTVISSLSLPRVTLQSRGNYTCLARNTISTVQMFDEETIPLFVLAVPAILHIDSSWNITQGTDVVLTCIVEGYPLPEIYWLKKDKEILYNNVSVTISDDITVTAELGLHQVSIHDKGTYICHANNSHGSVSSTVDVIVRVPPSINYITPKTAVTLNENFTVVLGCIVTGYPLPTINWEFNSGDNYESTTEEIEDGIFSQLLISVVALSQRGNYTCFATNSEGTERGVVELIINASPVVITDETQVTVVEEQNVVLTCFVTAFPRPDIFWEKEDLILRNLTELVESSSVEFISYLILDSVTLYSYGNYTCHASNSFGTGDATTKLIVSVPPLIHLLSTENRSFEGESITLRCEAVGFPLPSITWASNSPANVSMQYFNERTAVIQDREKFTTVSELTLRNATLPLRGNYECIASNSLGVVEDHIAVVIYAAPVIEELSSDVETTVNESITLVCTSFGFPSPMVSWVLNEQTLNDTFIDVNGFVIDDITVSSILTRNKIQPKEAGTYTCKAVNMVGTANSVVEITVIEPPLITYITSIIYASVNDSIKLECIAMGNPTPTLLWIHNGEYLMDEISFKNDSVCSVLILPIIQPIHMGIYYCIASNKGGENRAITRIDVMVAPTIHNAVTERTTSAGSMVTLECNATGNPPPNIYWMFQGVNITRNEHYSIMFNETISILKILRITIHDFGVYTCNAVNEEGETSENYTVIVFTSPSLQITRATCIASGYPQPKILWFEYATGELVSNGSSIMIFEEVLGTFSVQSSILTNLPSYTSGSLYYCHAVNNQGNISLIDSAASCSNDPTVTVEFEDSSYFIEESDTTLLVCLRTTAAESAFHVQVHPMQGTASADEDFDAHSVSIGFEPGSSIRCTHIPILDDHAVEDTEYFTVVVLTYYENVKIPLNMANVAIFDSDRTALRFEHQMYSMFEGDSISVCIIVEEDIQRSIYVSVVPLLIGELELTTMIEITKQRHCFEITAITDDDIEPKDIVTLELHTNDVAIYDTDTTTIVLSDNGGHGPDKLLRYHYGYPQVHPLCVIAYFQVQHDLKLEKCKLQVGGTYRENNCSDGYIAFYFEHLGDERPHTLIIEGHLEEQREPYMLSTVFHLPTLTTCWVYLINDGISVYENLIFLEWSGTGALNYRSDTFSYLCRIDFGAQQPCSSPHTFNDVSEGHHVIQIRHEENFNICLETPWQPYNIMVPKDLV